MEEKERHSANCLLFESSRGCQVECAIGSCLLAGTQTLCGGDIECCENMDTLRAQVLESIEKMSQP
jgi:hypothetical protein